MAIPRYSTDLVTFSDCSTVTGWVEMTGMDLGGGPDLDGDLGIYGPSCISEEVRKTGLFSLAFNFGSGVTIPTDGGFFIWNKYFAPNSVEVRDSAGLVVLIGSAVAVYGRFNIDGSDTYPYGGWVNYFVDPTLTPDSQSGTYNTTYQYLGTGGDAINAISKGNPHSIDFMRYGRGELIITNGNVTDGYANFSRLAELNDFNIILFSGTISIGSPIIINIAASAVTAILIGVEITGPGIPAGARVIDKPTASSITLDVNATANALDDFEAVGARWGLFQDVKGSKLYKGLMSLGTTATPVEFVDSNVNITIDDTIKASASFNRIEVNNASSVIDWTSILITKVGVISKGEFEMMDNATLLWKGCTLTDMSTFIFLSNATISLGTVFRRCGQITQGGATFELCNIEESTAPIALVVDDLSLVTGCKFISAGTGNAVDLGNFAANETLSWDNTESGYALQAGTAGDRTILIDVDSGVTITINVVDGASTPTYNNVGLGTVIIVAGQRTFKFTVNPSIIDYEWRIYTVTALGSLVGSVEIDGEEFATADNQTYSYAYTVDQFIAVQIISQPDEDYEELTRYFTLQDSNQDVTLILTPDDNN